LTLTRRGLTPLDILTAHSPIPGREAVALLLEEAMREQGWTGGRMEQRRRETEERTRRQDKRKLVQQQIGRVLGLDDHWWGEDREDDDMSDTESEGEDIDYENFDPMSMPYVRVLISLCVLWSEFQQSPSTSFTTMLVFSPATLSDILDSITYRAVPSLRCSEPARALYLLARFACLACDDTWLEDLMGGAFDRIERLVFVCVSQSIFLPLTRLQAKPDDIMLQTFWLYNTTALLHFLRCDTTVAEICDLLDLFSLLEGVIRAIYGQLILTPIPCHLINPSPVFIIRIAERKMDPLLDSALLDHAPLASEFDNIHFEDEWSIFRPFASGGAKLKKKAAHAKDDSAVPPSAGLRSSSRPTSPTPGSAAFAQNSPRFSWTQSLTRSRAGSITPSILLLSHESATPSPKAITAHLEALHTLFSLAGINPALTTQIFSQVLYWSACECPRSFLLQYTRF